MAKLLIDILHPAHVHFFRVAIEKLIGQGHEVLITSRDKDLTCELLDQFGFRHTIISRESRSKAGMAVELIGRNFQMLRIVLEQRPDTLASIAGISTAQVGALSRTRNVVFYDTEQATLSNRLSYPFADRVVTPRCYRGSAGIAAAKHTRYRGYHELAYLHRDHFQPKPEILEASGVDPEEPYSVVRLVSGRAVHDRGLAGLSGRAVERLIDELTPFGPVYVLSEDRRQPSLEDYRPPLSTHHVHHLLAFARMYVGQSATMASESAVLGTPALLIDARGRSYTDDQQDRYGTTFTFAPNDLDKAIETARLVFTDNLKSSTPFQRGWAALQAENIDVAEFVARTLLAPLSNESRSKPSILPSEAARS